MSDHPLFIRVFLSIFRVPVVSLPSSLMNASQAGLPHVAAAGGVRVPGEGTAVPSIATLTSGLQHSTTQQDSDDDYDE